MMPAADDSSGNGHTGNYFGSVMGISGAVGQGARFPSNSDYIVVPGSAAFMTNVFTVELWYRLPAIDPTAYYSPAGQRQDVSTGTGMTRGWNFYHIGSSTSDATLRPPAGWQFWTGNGNTIADASAWNRAHGSVGVAGQWYYLVGVGNANITKLYVNGVFAGSEAGTITGINSAVPALGIGAIYNENGTLGAHAVGDVDEVAFFNYELSAASVSTRYALRGDSAAYQSDVLADSPVGYWRLEDFSFGSRPPLRQRQNRVLTPRMRQKVR